MLLPTTDLPSHPSSTSLFNRVDILLTRWWWNYIELPSECCTDTEFRERGKKWRMEGKVICVCATIRTSWVCECVCELWHAHFLPFNLAFSSLLRLHPFSLCFSVFLSFLKFFSLPLSLTFSPPVPPSTDSSGILNAVRNMCYCVVSAELSTFDPCQNHLTLPWGWCHGGLTFTYPYFTRFNTYLAHWNTAYKHTSPREVASRAERFVISLIRQSTEQYPTTFGNWSSYCVSIFDVLFVLYVFVLYITEYHILEWQAKQAIWWLHLWALGSCD